MDINTIHIAIKLLDFAALFCCIGLLLARLVLLSSNAFANRSMAQRWHRLFGIALMLMTITGMMLLLVRVMQMSSTSAAEAIGLLPSVLRETHFGKTWAVHLVGLLLLWVCWSAQAQVSRRWTACITLMVLYLLTLTYSATSHAADAGDFTLQEWNDCVHLAAAASWGGGIFAALLLILPWFWQHAHHNRKFLNDILRRLSALSAVALAVVVASGSLNMAIRLGSFANLLDSPYGHILIGKLFLVAAMVAIGGINRFILIPEVARWVKRPTANDQSALRWLLAGLRADAILVLLVLTAASMLIQGMPPVTEHSMPKMMKHSHE
jgi:putative copper resistance protein D